MTAMTKGADGSSILRRDDSLVNRLTLYALNTGVVTRCVWQ